MPIYTRTGDSGLTALFRGQRVPKCAELVEVYGSVDELNSWVGLLVTYLKENQLKKFFRQIQADLFVIGGHLAGWEGDLNKISKRVARLEAQIDLWGKALPPLHNFILPGGTLPAAMAHLARSVCRRVERQVVALSRKQKIEADVIKYLNRLSDLFFVLARFINKKARTTEVTWTGNLPRQFNKAK